MSGKVPANGRSASQVITTHVSTHTALLMEGPGKARKGTHSLVAWPGCFLARLAAA